MIEAFEQRPDARAYALDNVFGWMQPQKLETKRILVLLGDTPVAADLVRRAVALVSAAAHIDLGVHSLKKYDSAQRAALQDIVKDHGSLLELEHGEYESLEVPRRTSDRQFHGMEASERRFLKKAFVARPLAEADLFIVIRNLELNRFSGIHGVFATLLDCVPAKTRTEVLSYASYGLMGEALLDVWSALPGQFLFGVFDGEQLHDETFGDTTDTGFIMAGIDPDDLDGYGLIASGCRVSYSPFSATASARSGKGRGHRAADVTANVSLEELRERVPAGFVRKNLTRRLFGTAPALRFSARPAGYDSLVCPTGAMSAESGEIPVVNRASCIGCGWCLKEYAEVTPSKR